MRYIKNIDEYTGTLPSVVTIGKFDGIHRGHQLLFRRIRNLGAEGFTTIAFTFDRQPIDVIEHRRIPLIMTPEERQRELENQKIDYLIECPFTEEIRHMEPEEFVEKILCERLHMKFLVVGDDFRFGYKGKGNCQYLIDHASEFGYEMNVVKCEYFEGEKISSTMIRSMISDGRIETANKLLGHDYEFTGEVIEGKHIGHRIGVPTLNIIPDPRKVLPPNGVYASRCKLQDGSILYGISNLGVNPTISEHNSTTLEMNLFEFNGSIYKQFVEVSLIKFIRPERKFESLKALQTQVLHDIDEVKTLFQMPHEV